MKAVEKPVKKNGPSLSVIALSVAVVILCWYIITTLRSSNASPTSLSFFTTDDGATTFIDSRDRLPPFDHYGKPAYRVTMLSADGGKTSFPGYLERCTPEGKARMESALKEFKAGTVRVPPDLSPEDLEIKKPGPGNPWISRTDARAVSEILNSVMAKDSNIEIQQP